MKTCEYEAVPVEILNLNKAKEENDKFFTIYFWRQLLLCIGLWELYFLVGVGIGSCTVVIAQMKEEAKSDNALSEEMVSWITSMFTVTSVPGVLLWTSISRYFGRRLCFNVTWVLQLIGYIIFYFTESTTGILITQAINGLVTASCYSNSLITISECLSPKYRGVALCIKSASLFWGIWAANAVGTFMHWRNIPFFALLIFPVFLTTFFWRESPVWLAEKGAFEESIKAHRFLKGRGLVANKEIERIISEQKNIKDHSNKMRSKHNMSGLLKKYFRIITKRNFYLPFAVSFLGLLMTNVSGKYIITMYAIEFLKKISSDRFTIYYTMLLLDGITVFGMYIGSLMSKFITRRTLLFSTTSVALLCMYVLSLYFYLIYLEVVLEHIVFVVIMLVIFSLALSAGPLIMGSSILGELIPAKSRTLFMNSLLLVVFSVSSIIVKTAPLVFKTFKMYGTFLYFGVTTTIITLVLFIYLPECKDKTLQEIEDCFLDKRDRENEVNDHENK